MDLGSEYETKELSTFVNQFDYTNEICKCEVDAIEENLDERIKNFSDINRQDLKFIKKFMFLSRKNPILKNFLEELNKTEVSLISRIPALAKNIKLMIFKFFEG